jgi:hypothetical protein
MRISRADQDKILVHNPQKFIDDLCRCRLFFSYLWTDIKQPINKTKVIEFAKNGTVRYSVRPSYPVGLRDILCIY